MNLTDPTIAITSTLDGPVLATLARAGKPLTVSEVADASVRGSEIGIRKSLGRLVSQGIVTAVELGHMRVYSLNREHVGANVALGLANLRSELWDRIARTVEGWKVRPLYACVFGSAARHQGGEESDIDLLLVRPSTFAELKEAQKKKTLMAALGPWADVISTRVMSDAQVKKWYMNIDNLHELVRRWTGNPLQVISVSAVEWSEQRRTKSEIYQSIREDEIRLHDEFGPNVYKYRSDEAKQR
jgi:predicted nucleotidyltransferase